MSLADRHVVDGTEPRVVIGRRQYRDRRTRVLRTCRQYTAELTLDGRQRRFALGTSNKAKAVREVHRRAAEGWEEKPPPPPPPAPPEVAELVEEYLVMKTDANLARRTLAKYRHVLNEFSKFCRERGLAATDLAEAHLWAFRASLKGKDKTRHDHLVIVKQLTRWAHRAGRIPANPFDGISLPEPESPRQPCLTPEEARAVLDAAEGPLRDMLTFLALTGCRVGELKELRWSAVELRSDGSGTLHIERGGSAGGTKTRASRRIPVTASLRELLERQPRTGPLVFPRPTVNGDGVRPINEKWLLNNVKRLAKKAGIAWWKDCKVHTLRHLFCSVHANAGTPERVTRALLGHKSSRVTDLYYTLYDRAAAEAMEQVDLTKPPRAAGGPAHAPGPAAASAPAAEGGAGESAAPPATGGNGCLKQKEVRHGLAA